MGEIMKLDSDKARMDPESVFANPRALIDEVGLTAGQKIAALERWETTVTLRLNAVSEGMAAPPGENSSDAELLKEIGLAKEALTSKDGA